MFGIDLPIFAFSHCRDVVVAVSRAGGFGVLGALNFTPAELEQELKWIDSHIDGKPYGVDVVMPASVAKADESGGTDKASLETMIPERHKEWLEGLLERYEVPPLPPGVESAESLLSWSESKARPLVDIALSHPIKLLVNALGPPPKDIVALAHQHGVKVAALIGAAKHAKKQVENGVDIIVAQGTEAGGHTGEVSTMVLVPEVVDAVAPVPVLAAGGIGCGRQVAAALALGAEGVWTGSVWLTVKESDTNPVIMQKLLAAGSSDTLRSRSITGKTARFLKTDWTQAWEAKDSPGFLPMPLQFMLVAEAQTRIQRAADNGSTSAQKLVGSPVGQIVGRMNSVRSSGEVIFGMVEEFMEAAQRLQQLLAAAEK
jgi:NAD(P)H-dependent flavin oxidoreductase YrpB (nitropropane dioxygenase family)